MKKTILLTAIAAMFLGVLSAQTKLVYEDAETASTTRLSYWTNNGPDGATVWMTEATNPAPSSVNNSAMVMQFDRKMGAGTNASEPWVMISSGIKQANSSDWGSYSMDVYPIIAMSVYSTDTMSIQLTVKNKDNCTSNCDLEWVKSLYDTKGSWKKMVFDFSNRLASDWPAATEVQYYFSHGTARDITVYYDNITGYKTVADAIAGINDSKKATNFDLGQNQPNPASDLTTITYSLKSSSNVALNIYDVTGKMVSTLVNEKQSIGNYSVDYNVANLNAGIYFYSLNVDGNTVTKKINVVK